MTVGCMTHYLYITNTYVYYNESLKFRRACTKSINRKLISEQAKRVQRPTLHTQFATFCLPRS